jgi:heat shock protein HtpX
MIEHNVSNPGSGRAGAMAQRAVRRALAWLGTSQLRLALVGPVAFYLMVVASLLTGWPGVAIGLILALFLATFGSRIPADTMLSLYRAEPIAPGQGAALRAALDTLSRRAELQAPPALAVIPSLAIGAFAVGVGSRTAVLLTEGLLRRHALPEIVSLTAHEIAHIRRGDLADFALADTLTRVAQLLLYFGLALLALNVVAALGGERAVSWLLIALLLLGPFLSSQLQLAVPKTREFDADRLAAGLLGDGQVLADALARQATDQGNLIDDFRFPVPQRRTPSPSPLRAHPTPAERSRQLRLASLSTPHAKLMVPDEPMISLVGFGPIEMKPRNRWPGLWF